MPVAAIPDRANQNPVLLWESGAGGDLTWCNAAWLAFRGRKAGDELGYGWLEGVHPGDQEAVRGGFEQAHAAGLPLEMELRMVREDGSLRWMLLQGAPGGGGFAGSCNDITRLKREAHESSERLSLAETLLERAPVGFAFLDTDLRFASVNPALQTMDGLPAEAHRGKTPSEVFGSEPGGTLEAQLRERLEVDEAMTGLELTGETADGRVAAWIVSSYPVRHSATGERLGVGLIVVDVSEQEAARSELRQVADDLRRANAVKDEVLGLVSHELRTPLTTLRGNANALARHGRALSEEQRNDALGDIERDAERLQQIVENMLILARIEASDEVEVEPVRLQRVIERAVADHRIRHPWHPVSITYTEELPPALAHTVYFRQVLTNLLSNAAKYSDPDKPIDVEVGRLGDSAIVRVLDRGAGIAQEEAERIFDPFYRSSETATRASGMGLGLSVCKRLVEEQGGEIAVARREGGGTAVTFSVRLITDEYPE
ncbi:MAG: PAS domain-containing protein [Dehalococcoidia bacterium]|nr:PAS domain-containing protein [Dehalococcoidia bacterium]